MVVKRSSFWKDVQIGVDGIPEEKIETLQISQPPKEFWKYYDLYRRKKISILEFSQRSGLAIKTLNQYLRSI